MVKQKKEFCMEQKNGIATNIILLGIVSFLNDLSSEMIMPILPLFITSLGGAGIAIGLIGGARDSITSFLKIISGYISDKTGKRKVLVFSGYFTSSVFKLLLALSKTWQHIFVFISFERVGKGLRDAPRDALIADAMPNQKGKAFGINRAFDSSGALLGSIVAFILLQLMGFALRTIIFIAAIFAFFSLVPLLFVRDHKTEYHAESFKATLVGLPLTLKLFFGIATLFALANFSYMFFIMRAQQLFGGGYALGIPLLLYILFNSVYAILSIPFGLLSDKIGRKKVLMMGYALFALTTLGFATFHSLAAYIVLFVAYGLVNAIIDANQRAFVADLAQGTIRGTSLGAYYTLTGLVALPASVIAGALWNYAPAAPFVYGTITSMSALCLFVFMRKRL
jgi:MFS family permease